MYISPDQITAAEQWLTLAEIAAEWGLTRAAIEGRRATARAEFDAASIPPGARNRPRRWPRSALAGLRERFGAPQRWSHPNSMTRDLDGLAMAVREADAQAEAEEEGAKEAEGADQEEERDGRTEARPGKSTYEADPDRPTQLKITIPMTAAQKSAVTVYSSIYGVAIDELAAALLIRRVRRAGLLSEREARVIAKPGITLKK